LCAGVIALQTLLGQQICPGAGTRSKPPGAVSRYKLGRKQLFVTVQNFGSGQMRVSGDNSQQDFYRKQD
jgi:hypothetical protein